MNNDQFLSIIRSLLKMGGVYLAQQGWVSSSHAEFISGAILALLGFIFSHVTHSDDDPAAPKQGTLLSLLFLLVILPMVGCTNFHTHLEVRADGTRLTDTLIRTFFDGKSELSKQTTSNAEKTQRTGIDGLSEESSGSNAVALVQSAVSAAVKSAKP